MFLVILILGLVIAMIYVNVNAEAVAAGREIQAMQNSIEIVERSIADKEAHLAYITSAVEMEKRALEIGFQPVNPGDAKFIVIQGYRGRVEAILAPPAKPAAAQARILSPEYSLSLVDWLKQELYLPTKP